MKLNENIGRKKGIDWGIVTEKELPVWFVKNVQWVHKFYFLDSKEDEILAFELLKTLTNKNSQNLKIINFCNRFDEDYNLEVGTALTYVKHLIARKLIAINMVEKLDIRKIKISEITIKDSGGEKFDYISS